ncbi:OmpA family protein [Flavobacterium cerinum]|uniref:OmpA family protein n=1 Tax=Flavobacterium cerinum TaxID=2502784 RepID=A0A3S3QFF7_9FLAO|nr:OmpA family protein [Flavobacterium cerinum]RWW92163.1 OmpA family protein [Flavobacterium cerinum]
MNRIFLTFILLCSFYAIAQEDSDADTALFNYDLEGLTIDGKVGDKITLQNLNFERGGHELRLKSEPVLKELLKIMEDHPDLKIQIQGHICCLNDDSNEVSSARAELVHNYLRDNCIDEERISYKDFGGTKPIYPMPEKNKKQREKNRRVEIEIIEN